MLPDGKAFNDEDASSVSIASIDHNLLKSPEGTRCEFVGQLAPVNTVKSETKDTRRLQYAERQGFDPLNSVGLALRLQFKCPFVKQGYPYEGTPLLSIIKTHVETCKYNVGPGDEPPQVSTDRPFVCEEPGCNKKYKRKGELTAHARECHDRIQCWVLGCTAQEAFIGEKAFKKHVELTHTAKGQPHPSIPDQSTAKFDCAFQDCKSSFQFYSRGKLHTASYGFILPAPSEETWCRGSK